MQRLTKEYKIENDFLNIKLGTINRLEPIVFYIDVKGWIKLIDGNINVIKGVLNEFKKDIKNFISNNNLNYKFIYDYDVNFNNLSEMNFSFMTVNICFKQNSIIPLKEYSNEVKLLIQDFINILNSNNVSIIKKK